MVERETNGEKRGSGSIGTPKAEPENALGIIVRGGLSKTPGR